MSWAAANIPNRKDADDSIAASRTKDSKRRGETVEAVLSRLSKAYSLAMECFGAMHDTNGIVLKKTHDGSDEERRDSLKSLRKLAYACRTTLENAVLSDPLIFEHCPTLRHTIQGFADKDKGRWTELCKPRPEPPQISSKAHRTTIRHLSYLALTNYADLLMSACTCSCARSHNPHNSQQLLDRGVVKKLKAFSGCVEDVGCCWSDDSESQIQRLALVSLCDASALDGSDPVVWLKLACAARSMGHINALPDRLSSPVLSSFRRLERHALESGYRALPATVPPNRAIARSLEEFNSDEFPDMYPSIFAQIPEPFKLNIDLTRYSWSLLGRLLMNVVKEGTGASALNAFGQRQQLTQRTDFGSPSVTLTLSPMLLLPSSALGSILLFLDTQAIWRFEATCRALSASIMSARATLEKQSVDEDTADVPPEAETPVDIIMEREEEARQEEPILPTSEQRELDMEHTNGVAPAEEPLRISRSSKRVRSQQINSDKKEERHRKRQSVEFCLRAATCGSTCNKPPESIVNAPIEWNQIRGKSFHLPANLESSPSRGKGFSTEGSRQRFEASERIGSASLKRFLEKTNGATSTNVLDHYLCHIALHVEEVFSVDPGDLMVLTSSIIGCLKLATQRNTQVYLLPRFFNHEQVRDDQSIHRSMELFAIDVLHVELRFKTCERQQCSSGGFDDDSNFVCCMIPVLLRGVAFLNQGLAKVDDKRQQWSKLRTRVNWLAAGVFLWRSRFTRSVCESIEAEEQGLEFIDSTIGCLGPDSPGMVATPHLESPVRNGAHWRKLCSMTLSTYREEIEASSVVSHAQQKFQERVAAITKRATDANEEGLSEDDVSALSEIGETLLARYRTPFASAECRHGELLDSFIASHGDECLDEPVDFLSNAQEVHIRLPVSAVSLNLLSELPNPSTLTILIFCLQVKSSNHKAMTVLLVRLLLTALNQHERITRSRSNEGESPDHFSDSEDADSVQNDAVGDADLGSDGISSSTDAIKCGRLIKYLVDSVFKAMSRMSNDEDKAEVVKSDEFLKAVHHCLGFCSLWAGHFAQQASALEEVLDRKVFMSACLLVNSLLSGKKKKSKSLEELYLGGLVRILHSQRQSFASRVRVQGAIRSRRAVRQRICILRAEFIGTVLCQVSKMLSENLVSVTLGRMERSKLLEANLFSVAGDSTNPFAPPMRVQLLCENLLWFKRYMKEAEENPSNSFDRPIIDRLRVPLAAAIVGFCGSSSCTRSNTIVLRSNDDFEEKTDPLALQDFLDSDASAHELSDSEEATKEDAKPGHVELLRVACHLVHSTALVFGKLDEKEIVSFDGNPLYHTDHGPLLPLVVTRVLNSVADFLLREFAEEESENGEEGVWSSKYPFGSGKTGLLLDSTLYKAYKCLHGFNLSSSNDNSAKEHVHISNSDIETNCFAPESHQAAAQLYRCIARAGKKTPPKAALQTVSSALPALKESTKSQMISEFLFSTETKRFGVEDVNAIASENQGWKKCFEMIQWHNNGDQEEYKCTGTIDNDGEGTLSEDEIMFLRKGVFSLLAQGDLPVFSRDFGGKEDDRAGAARFEEELSKKFTAILNTLKYGDTNDIRGWFRAAQCLMLKTKIVAERLGMSKGFARSKGFSSPENWTPAVTRHPVAILEEKQEQELMVRDLGWLQYIGDDLSLYINYQWSSFESLKELSKVVLVESKTPDIPDDETEAFVNRVVRDIQKMQNEDRLVEWQQSWGGMFVAALKKVTIRCLCLAIYLFYENSTPRTSTDDDDLLPEILETLGVTMYSGLLGSQSYGYPMHVTPVKCKRQVAEAARACFRRALDIARSASDGEDAETWDLAFMIGKCNEKIAGTYKLERYHQISDPSDGKNGIRRFEYYMKKALDAYQDALNEKPEVDHCEAGGSSHGETEILYRLHASRLKCLLLAAEASEDERVQAEEEALRLTEIHWFLPPSNPYPLPTSNVRDRIWAVLADVCTALAKCRLSHPFFHRSVYRHAQALMWAPYFSDPVSGRLSGTVPATRSCQIRGLNHATNAAKSALAIMTSLFEKKRSQLCAVWVTLTPSPTPFEALNNSVRKYDSLRGKYISAYIDCLRLSGSRNELETFLRWLSSSKRDLPSFYQASAKTGGGKPEKSHNHDSLLLKNSSLSSFNLLTGLKRYANAAMANVLTQELLSRDSNVRSVENRLKLAYACFLRQNCSLKALKRTRAWKYDPRKVWEAEALCQAFLKLNSHSSIQTDPNDWSGGGQKAAILGAALVKCKQLFPSVSGSYYSKKATSKKGETEDKDPNEKSSKKRSYEVKVPEGLDEGETFTTTIKAGGSAKKVKLTVPSGNPRLLRFSLDLSTQTDE